MSEALILYTTWPDAETAQATAEAAVEAGLCACVNIETPITSVYRWEGRLERSAEVPALFKTTRAAAEALRALILSRHPYDLPCIAALAIDAQGSHAAYLAWIDQETASSPA